MDEPVPDAEALTPLDPAYVKAVRLRLAFPAAGAVIGAGFLEWAELVPRFAVLGPVLLAAAIVLTRIPRRRWQARGYRMAADRLRVVRGLLVRRDTTVPFGRVQHLDVEQGPIERLYGLGTLVLHTAGNHNASVRLSGIRHSDAVAMRDAIRAHVTRASQ